MVSPSFFFFNDVEPEPYLINDCSFLAAHIMKNYSIDKAKHGRDRFI